MDQLFKALKAALIINTMSLIPLIATACSPSRPADCTDGALARIEAAYIAEIVQSCEGQRFDTCDAKPAIDDKYNELREEWVQCKN